MASTSCSSENGFRSTPAVRADLPGVSRLGALLVRLDHELDPRRFIPAGRRTEDGYASFLGTQLDEPSVVVLVAERDGQILGYAYAEVEGHYWTTAES